MRILDALNLDLQQQEEHQRENLKNIVIGAFSEGNQHDRESVEGFSKIKIQGSDEQKNELAAMCIKLATDELKTQASDLFDEAKKLLEPLASEKNKDNVIRVSAQEQLNSLDENPDFIFYSGVKYLNGFGDPQDRDVGIELLTEAAENYDHSGAQYVLGRLYTRDDKELKDEKQGMEFLEKAASNGHESAKELLEELRGSKHPNPKLSLTEASLAFQNIMDARGSK
jgi:TPR repeat protein